MSPVQTHTHTLVCRVEEAGDTAGCTGLKQIKTKLITANESLGLPGDPIPVYLSFFNSSPNTPLHSVFCLTVLPNLNSHVGALLVQGSKTCECVRRCCFEVRSQYFATKAGTLAVI